MSTTPEDSGNGYSVQPPETILPAELRDIPDIETASIFTFESPLRVVVANAHGRWHEHVVREHRDEMIKRELQRQANYIGNWNRRRKLIRGTRERPRYFDHHGDDRFPISLTAREWVQFECDHPFMVVIMPEPDVAQMGDASPVAGTDRNFPFSATSVFDPKTCTHTVKAEVSITASAQQFYKLLFVVLDQKVRKPELIDPDFYIIP